MSNDLAAMYHEALLLPDSIFILFLSNMVYSLRKENMTQVLVFSSRMSVQQKKKQLWSHRK